MLPKTISDSIVRLIINEPFYAHIISQLNIRLSDAVPIAGVRLALPIELLINQEAFERYPPVVRNCVLKHEVLHLVMEHFVRGNKRDSQLWNIAADLAVNCFLSERELPEGAITVKTMEKQLGISLPWKASAERYYEILEDKVEIVEVKIITDDGSDENPNQDNKKRIRVKVKGANDIEAEFDLIDEHPDEIPADGETAAREIIREVVREIVQEAAKLCGNTPGELTEYINALKNTGKIDWRRVVSRLLLGRGKMIATPTYLRESRRFEMYPGRRKTIGMEALVAIDTSGSMSDETLQKVLAHLLKIKKISGTRIWITWGDIRREGGPIPIERVGKSIKFTGRGGTDLCWPFEIANKMRLPVVVCFTDGYGPAPESVRQKVLWAITKGGRVPARYGMSVEID